MQLNALFTDDDAVSPVIGVILMVAITVILAAVIATFVLGLGEQISDTSPQASFDFDYEGTDLTITHTGGETIEPANLFIAGTTSDDGPWSGELDSSSRVSAGNSYTVTAQSTETVSVIWQSDDGGQSAPLATWSGADA